MRRINVGVAVGCKETDSGFWGIQIVGVQLLFGVKKAKKMPE